MKSLGIIGGMGPLATVDIYKKITEGTLAHSDAEHMHIYIDSNVNISDRTQAILQGTKGPVSELVSSAQKLESIGAEFLLMACNTAHYFYDDVVRSVSVPVLNMIEEAAQAVQDAGIKKIAVLATAGTLQSGLYTAALQKRNISVVLPTDLQEQSIMSVIYDCVKAANFNYDIASFINTLENLKEQGAEAFLLGCTELPHFFSYFGLEYPTFDSVSILAQKAILFAGYSLVPSISAQ